MPRGVPKSGKRKPRKGNLAGRAAKGYGRLVVSGSTRYTAKGSKKKAPRLKTYAATSIGTSAGSAVGSAIGQTVAPKKYKAAGAGAGAFAGSIGGQAAGRKVARKRGWQTRTKKRMTVRAVNKRRGKK